MKPQAMVEFQNLREVLKMLDTQTSGKLFWRTTAMVAVLMLGLAVISWHFQKLPFQKAIQDGLAQIAPLGPISPSAYLGVYILGSVLFLPCFPLTLGAGFLFGFSRGFAIASVSSTIGAITAFVVSRYVARSWLVGRMERNPDFRAIDRAVIREGWKVVFLSRLASILPYNLVNYVFGLTGIPLGRFALATWVGRLPITGLHTYVGSLAADLASLDAKWSEVSFWEYGAYFFGWLATLAATFYIFRLARNALKESLNNQDTLN